MEITKEMQELIEAKAAEIAEEKAKEIAETKAAEIVKQVAEQYNNVLYSNNRKSN